MKRRENFKLCQLGSTPYLLPFGQAAANLQRGVRINQTGVFLWNALQHETTKETLFSQLIEQYQPTEKELPLLEQDLENFLRQLNAYEMLSFSETDKEDNQIFHFKKITDAYEYQKTLEIGGIAIVWQGPKILFPTEFMPFCTDFDKTNSQKQAFNKIYKPKNENMPALNITVTEGAPYRPPVGQLLIRTRELMIIKSEQGYHCVYSKQCGLMEWHLTNNAQNSVLYYQMPWTTDASQEIFHAIRMIFLLAAQNYGLFALHSASILYRNKAVLFSGHSGAGKSTHAALWNECYQTPLLNGDLNLIKLTSHGPLIMGMPWCGTSGVCTTNAYALSDIVFIKQCPDDQIQFLSDEEKELAVLQRIISPNWTEDQFIKNLSFARQLSRKIPIHKLKCTKHPVAAATCKAAIDAFSSV